MRMSRSKMSETQQQDNSKELYDSDKESKESLIEKTIEATMRFINDIDYEFEGQGAETAHSLKQNIKIVRENIALPGVDEKLSPDQKELINETLKRAQIKLNYLEGKPQDNK